MVQLTGLDLFYWAASFIANICLLVVLFLRHRAAQFPIFTTLAAFGVLRTIALYVIHHHGTPRGYFNYYWRLAFIDEALQILVVYELARHVFRPAGDWTREIRNGSLLLSCASLVIAGLLTRLATPITRLTIQAVVIKENFFFFTIMSELFVGMIALSAIYGVAWNTHATRIAQSLGLYSIIGFITQAAVAYVGVSRDTHLYVTLSHIRIGSYLVCSLYWIVTFWKDAPSPQELPERIRLQLAGLQRQLEYEIGRLQTWKIH